jgi:hypothetical protein
MEGTIMKIDFEEFLLEWDSIRHSRMPRTIKQQEITQLLNAGLRDPDFGGDLRAELERIACVLVPRLPNHRATNRVLRVLAEAPSVGGARVN